MTIDINEQGASSLRTAIKPILKYPGAKWRLASWIVDQLPSHVSYVEPYCGSAAVFLNKPPSHHEVINDLNSHIINLFRVIRDHGQELASRIDLTLWSREEYELCERHPAGTGDSIEDARRFLVRCWQAHGTKLGTSSGWRNRGPSASASTVDGWCQVPERLLATVARFKDAEIEHRPALDLIIRYNHPEVLLYCDPPYIMSTRTSRGHYPYEMTNDEHTELLEVLKRHRGMVLISGYAHSLYDNLLQDWYRISMPTLAEKGLVRTEVLWLNQKAAQTRQMPLFTKEVAV